MKNKYQLGWTLLETLIIVGLGTLLFAAFSPWILRRHQVEEVPNSGRYIVEEPVSQVGYACEFLYDGCQYVKFAQGVSHKGNCTNQIHGR